MNAMGRPGKEELEPFYHGYLDLAEGDDPIHALKQASDRLWKTVYRIPPGYADHRYAPGKWSIKEVFQHVIDSERIFSYRALRFARYDDTELPGFDENHFAAHASVDHREFHDLLKEHDVLRTSTIALFRSFTPEMGLRTGLANGNRISVRALAWVIAGHNTHHMNVIDQRYLGGHGET